MSLLGPISWVDWTRLKKKVGTTAVWVLSGLGLISLGYAGNNWPGWAAFSRREKMLIAVLSIVLGLGLVALGYLWSRGLP